MLEFEKEQKVIEIADVKIGGQPGENSVVAVGSVFYSKHDALKNEKTGEFDKDMVEEEINEFMTIVDETNLQAIIDVVGANPDALIKECKFVADLVDIPFLVDGLNDEIRIPAMEGMKEAGLLDRAILNSIDDNTNEEDVGKLKEIGVKNAVLLTFGTRYIFPEQKLSFLKDDLIPKAERAGIKNIIVDTAVLDLASLSLNYETTRLVKNELGLPAGYAPSNGVYGWDFVKQYGDETRAAGIAAAMVNALDAGSDFILYGPIKFSKWIIPSLALIEATNSYYRKRILRKNVSDKTPLNKIFK
ncbi:MAG: Tetrahydromethanopterin S-methyltransferase subunit H [Promethearchaeota archaeon]|nr:MAG: Tetrahydromethanopterin S-methyltransferase subunit H [Candidatus Lokiarchaeota archaeon]